MLPICLFLLRSLTFLKRAVFVCTSCSFAYVVVPFRSMSIMTSRLTAVFSKLRINSLTCSSLLFGSSSQATISFASSCMSIISFTNSVIFFLRMALWLLTPCPSPSLSRSSLVALARRSRSSLVARRSSLVARRSSLVARRSSLVARRSSLVARRSSLVARRSSLVARRSSLVARRSSLVARRSSLVARRSSLSLVALAYMRAYVCIDYNVVFLSVHFLWFHGLF